jgi:hypothetical protein
MHYMTRKSEYTRPAAPIVKHIRSCLKNLYARKDLCQIARNAYCACSVEQEQATIWHLSRTHRDALDEIYKVLEPNKNQEIPRWAISDQGSLSMMYWCDSEKWWLKMYGRIPRHFLKTGYFDTV